MRRRKSLRIGVHLANGVVWGLVYRTRLNSASVGRAIPARPVAIPCSALTTSCGFISLAHLAIATSSATIAGSPAVADGRGAKPAPYTALATSCGLNRGATRAAAT